MFDAQAHALKTTNVVYQGAEYKQELVAEWCPEPGVASVPPLIVDTVVAVPVDGSPGDVVAAGPAASGLCESSSSG